jgi:hypothetical protein
MKRYEKYAKKMQEYWKRKERLEGKKSIESVNTRLVC